MFNTLLILDSKCESIITQHYKHNDFALSTGIYQFKSQLLSNRECIDNNSCVQIIKGYSYIFVKYSDIIICIITRQNVNVFSILSFEYQLINTIKQYICDNHNNILTSSEIRNDIVLVLEILNEMILDGYPQPIFDEKYLIHQKKITTSNTLFEQAKQQREILCKVTGASPWRSHGTNIGFSVGGAKDINNFRDCINKQILPKTASLTYNGLFYEYYFKNINDEKNDNEPENTEEGCNNKLFYPSYCYAKCKDDYYISVGLNSNIKTNEFKRNKLNLMIVLDISGSMTLPFKNSDRNIYNMYNDMIENKHQIKTKIDMAKHCLINLILNHIHTDDRFCILLFNHDVNVLTPFQMFENINKNDLIQKIKQITAHGGTKLGNAYKHTVNLYKNLKGFTDNIYDNRVIFLTDAKQNLNYSECKPLIDLSTKYSAKSISEGRICTTFIGIGIDFDTELISKINNNLFGCNYFAVHSLKQFKDTMTEQFDFMVSPLIFNLKLQVKSEGNNYQIDKIYGNDNDSYNELMNVKTLFPSKSNAKNEIKGGIILVKIKQVEQIQSDSNLDLELIVSYEDRFGKTFGNNKFINFNKNKNINNDECFYDNNGIRKACLLIKYVELLKRWMNDTSIFCVSKTYKHLFSEFLKYFQAEMEIINDKTLEKEVKILQQLIQKENIYLGLSSINEVSLQITERINVLINNKLQLDNKISNGKCMGRITMSSALMGMPICKMGLFVGKNQNCNWKFHPCVQNNRYDQDIDARIKHLMFTPPDGTFDIGTYVIYNSKSIDIPFDIIHNINHTDWIIHFDVTLKTHFDSNRMANDIIIKIPLSTEYYNLHTHNVCIKTTCGTCELKNINNNAYLVWNINKLYAYQYCRLHGKVHLNKFGRTSSLIRTTSLHDGNHKDDRSISLQFEMSERISTCVKVMYLNVTEPKLWYKTKRKIKYMITTDEKNNIKFKI